MAHRIFTLLNNIQTMFYWTECHPKEDLRNPNLDTVVVAVAVVEERHPVAAAADHVCANTQSLYC
jgi:hypothetical protein